MKLFIPSILALLLFFSLNNLNAQYSSGPSCIPDCPADQFSTPYQTTIIQFENGNQYGKLNNGNWLKLNDNGFKVLKSKSTQHQSHNKSQHKGKWIISDSSSSFSFYESPYPKKMVHYKDSFIIITGLDAQVDTHYIFINRSTDQGKSWHRIYQEFTASAEFDFYQIQHPTLSRIVAISKEWVKDSLNNYRKASILMTSIDTAASWTVNDSIFGIYDSPRSLNFNGKYGIIVQSKADTSILLYSNDYGDSWTSYPLPADLRYADGRVLSNGEVMLMDQFTNSKLGYIADINSDNWQFENLPDTFDSNNIYIRNKDTIWSATGVKEIGTLNLSRNIIVGSTDGGKSWKKPLDIYESNKLQRIGLINITFVTKNQGVALGTNVFYFTEDGGKT